MSIVERYLALADQGRFEEGLPVIEEIVAQNPNVPTSQFNYGVCLAALGRHADAAAAFLRAYALDSQDGGALYRGCLALVDAHATESLLKVFRRECERDPALIHRFVEEKRFSTLWTRPDFAALRNTYEVRGIRAIWRRLTRG